MVLRLSLVFFVLALAGCSSEASDTPSCLLACTVHDAEVDVRSGGTGAVDVSTASTGGY